MLKPEKFDCEKTELSGITDRSHKTTVSRQLGMQELHCRSDSYVCRRRQGEIERIHPPPTSSKNRLKSVCDIGYANLRPNLFVTCKKILIEVLVGMGLHA